MAIPKIEIKHLSKSFGAKKVLTDMNLTVEKGESIVVIGGSGSGKSVFLKCMLGLLDPTDGEILIDGYNTTHLKEKDRYELMKKFGMLFQGGALFDSMSIWENIGFPLIQEGEKLSKVRDIAIDKLAMVGLQDHVADQRPSELSGGMQKRVSLARAICLEPEIIFYDEPTTGLDPITSDVINDLIIKMRDELGCTSVTITHDMHSAYKIADRMAMLYKGELIAKGSVKEIRTSSNPYVKQFISGSAEGPIQMATRTHKNYVQEDEIIEG